MLTRRTEIKYCRLITAIAGFVVAVSTALFGAAAASADPDPHIPDPANDYCPGSGLALKIMWGYCDGAPYPDGSYWRVTGIGEVHISTVCVTGPHRPLGVVPAPPGGCGGAV